MKIHDRLNGTVAVAGLKLELLFLALFSLGKSPNQSRVVVRQVARLCTEGLAIVAICGFFGGMTLVVVMSAGDWHGVGRGQISLAVVRLAVAELMPMLAAGALALSATTARSATERGNPSSSEYARDVLLPRLISLVIATPILWGLCTLVVTCAWAVVACAQSGMAPGALVESLESMWTWSEIKSVWAAFAVGGLKASLLGAVVAVAAFGPVGGHKPDKSSASGSIAAVVVANYFFAWIALTA
jgi:ABC-type transporter Mla maintaining outer membrane lipid asymmetry permease subunit MlaE